MGEIPLIGVMDEGEGSEPQSKAIRTGGTG
jgi:hypothetical protein